MGGAIDIWCNGMTPELLGKYTSYPEIKVAISWMHQEDQWRGRDLKEFISMLDEAGVERVFIPSIQMRSFQQKEMAVSVTPHEVADLVSKCPDRLSGLCGINPYKKMDGVYELEKAVKEYGFVGAHLHTYGFERAFNDRDYWPFYAKCVELDIPVVMQTGHSAEFMPSALARPILLDDVALYFPQLKIVAAHTGWPWTEELIALAWKHPNIYIGTSAYAPKYWDKSLVHFANSIGKGKVLFGTDYPLVLHKDAIEQIEGLGLKEDAKRLLLREAAKKVFRL